MKDNATKEGNDEYATIIRLATKEQTSFHLADQMALRL
jgi:hypothetical protein